MKLDETKPHSVHLRLTEKQYAFCVGNAEVMGIGVADFIRMLVNTMAVTSEKARAALGDLGSGNDANNSNDIEHCLQ